LSTLPKPGSKDALVLWIIADETDREHLESLGVELGPYNTERKEFNPCRVTPEALDKLDPWWGEYWWGPVAEQEEVCKVSADTR